MAYRNRRNQGGDRHNDPISNAQESVVESEMKKKMKEWKEEAELLGLTGAEMAAYVREEKQREIVQQERQVEIARQEREREADRQAELRRIELEHQDREAARQAHLREMEIQGQQNNQNRNNNNQDRGRPKLKIKLPFLEDGDDLETYLWKFERVMEAEDISRQDWSLHLIALVKGKAAEALTRMSQIELADYNAVKIELLKKFRLTSEEYREKLRNAKKKHEETAVELMSRITQWIQRWVELSGRNQTYDDVVELLAVDVFVDALPHDQALFVRERRPSTKDEATKAAETYELSRRNRRHESKSPHDKFRHRNSMSPRNMHHHQESRKGSQDPSDGATNKDDRRGNRVGFKIECYNCGGPHKIAFCPKRKQNALCVQSSCDVDHHNHAYGQPSGIEPCCQNGNHHVLRVGLTSWQGKENEVCKTTLCDRCSKIKYQPSCQVTVEGKEVPALRDTGATISCIDTEFVPRDKYLGVNRTVTFASGEVKQVPVARVNLKTPFFEGNADVLVMQGPVVPVLIGNSRFLDTKDINAIPVYPIQQTERKAKEENRDQTMHTVVPAEKEAVDDQKVPTVKPSEEKGNDSQHLTATIHDEGKRGISEKEANAECAQVTTRSGDQRTKNKPLKIVETKIANVTPEQLKDAQKKDETLKKCREDADGLRLERKGSKSQNAKYTWKNGVLVRTYTENSSQRTQIVVPQQYRDGVMQLAHDVPMSGHLGVRKTTDRLWADFYWPGISGDVRRYCSSCDACQRSMPKGKQAKAPLGKVPSVETPFEKIGIDLIGPIEPSSERGYRYILTVVDYATRYPEAIPLKTCNTTEIAEALWTIWTRIGVPKEIVSDQGQQFVGEIMKQLQNMLDIRGIKVSAYHPMANGLAESFNGTLKQMMKKMCLEQPREWDRMIPALLFAYREVPQSSMLFSPFELLYGRTVRGPMQILKNLWLKEQLGEEEKTDAQYVIDLRNRIEDTCQIARDNLAKASQRYAKNFNKKTKERHIEEGSKVLLLLPEKHNKLQLTWKGPFKVIKKINDLDYKIDVNGKEKVYHANLLKNYIEREPSQQPSQQIAVVAYEDREEECDYKEHISSIPTLTLEATEGVEDSHIADTLNETQVKQIKEIRNRHSRVLRDVPGNTDIETCKLRSKSDKPVYVKQYALPHASIETVKEEVKKMKKMGVIEPTVSAYNAPIVLVKKKDGSTRFCIDFRALNKTLDADPDNPPNIDQLLAKMGKAKYFSKIDCTRGYWQCKVQESDKHKTAFTTPEGQFQWTRMPFGLKTAGATFTRMMRKVLGPLQRNDVDNFIDDIMIATETWQEHLEAVEAVLARLEEVGLTAKPSKCYFGYEEIEYLGHKVGHSQIKPEQEKIEKLKNAAKPKTKKEVRAFLGLASYYRKFVPNFAEISASLTEMTKARKPDKVEWNDESEYAFKELKRVLCEEPVIHMPDQSKPFILRTDASNSALGAVLMQEKDGEKHPIAYASRKLSPAEQNYATIEKECLAVVWGIKKFEPYLFDRKFVLETDHQPLHYLKRSKTENGRLMRWALQLQQHDFQVKVIKGKDNIGADYLSRIEEED